MDLLIILTVVGFLLGLLAYYLYRLLLSIQHTLQDLHAVNRSIAEWSYSTATQARYIRSDARYTGEQIDAWINHSNELRRHQLLQEVHRHAFATAVTPIAPLMTPHTPVPSHTAWIGDQALKAWQATRFTNDRH
ncbi:MAG TPA: hypothetical protein VKR06_46400 [Ktedonosporobacter sp.]|nr:hypothetical protein [Ktedonosporobacter sp.]